jgi:hypothetical protein
MSRLLARILAAPRPNRRARRLQLPNLEERSAPGDITGFANDALMLNGSEDLLGGTGFALLRTPDDLSFLGGSAAGTEAADLNFRAGGTDLFVVRSTYSTFDDLPPEEESDVEAFGAISVAGTTNPTEGGGAGAPAPGESPSAEALEDAFDSAANAWNASLAASTLPAPEEPEAGPESDPLPEEMPPFEDPTYSDPETVHESWDPVEAFDQNAFTIPDPGLPADLGGFEGQHAEEFAVLRGQAQEGSGQVPPTAPAAVPFDVEQILAAPNPNNTFREALAANRHAPAAGGGAQPINPQALFGAAANTPPVAGGTTAPLAGGRTTAASFNGTLTYGYEWRVLDPQGNVIRDLADSVTYPLNATTPEGIAALTIPDFPWTDSQFKADVGANFLGTFHYRETVTLDWTAHATVEAGTGDADWNWGTGLSNVGVAVISDRSVQSQTDLTYEYDYEYTEDGGGTRVDPTETELGHRTVSADYYESESESLGWNRTLDVRFGGVDTQVGGSIGLGGPSLTFTPRTSSAQFTETTAGHDGWGGTENGHYDKITALAGPGQILPANPTVLTEDGDYFLSGEGWQTVQGSGRGNNSQLPPVNLSANVISPALLDIPSFNFSTFTLTANRREDWSDTDDGHAHRVETYDPADTRVLQVNTDGGDYTTDYEETSSGEVTSFSLGVDSQGTVNKRAAVLVEVRNQQSSQAESDDGNYERTTTTTPAGQTVHTSSSGDYTQDSSESVAVGLDTSGVFVRTGNGSIASGTFSRRETGVASSSAHIGGTHTVVEDVSAAEIKTVDTRDYTYRATDTATTDGAGEDQFVVADGDMAGFSTGVAVSTELTLATVSSATGSHDGRSDQADGTGLDTETTTFKPAAGEVQQSLRVETTGRRRGTFQSGTNKSATTNRTISGVTLTVDSAGSNVGGEPTGGPLPGSSVQLPNLVGTVNTGQGGSGSGVGQTTTGQATSFEFTLTSTASAATTANGRRADDSSSDVTATGTNPQLPGTIGGVPVGTQPPPAGGGGPETPPPEGTPPASSGVTGQASVSSRIDAATTLARTASTTIELDEAGRIGVGEVRLTPGTFPNLGGSGSGYVAEYHLNAAAGDSSTYTENGRGRSGSTITGNTNGDTSVRSSDLWSGRYGTQTVETTASDREERGYGFEAAGFVPGASALTGSASAAGTGTLRTRSLREEEDAAKSYTEQGTVIRNNSLNGTGTLIGKANTAVVGTYHANETNGYRSDLTVNAESVGMTGNLSATGFANVRAGTGSLGTEAAGSGTVRYAKAKVHSVATETDTHDERGGRSSTENSTASFGPGETDRPALRTKSNTVVTGAFNDRQTATTAEDRAVFGRSFTLSGSVDAGATGNLSVGWDGINIGGGVSAGVSYGTDKTTYLGEDSATSTLIDTQAGTVKREVVKDSGPPAAPPPTTAEQLAGYIDRGLAIPGGIFRRLPSFLQAANPLFGLVVQGTESLREPGSGTPTTPQTSTPPKEWINADTTHREEVAESGRYQEQTWSTRNGNSVSAGAGVTWDGGWSLPSFNFGTTVTAATGESESSRRQSYGYTGMYKDTGGFSVTPAGTAVRGGTYELVEGLVEASGYENSGSYSTTTNGQTSSSTHEGSGSTGRDFKHSAGGTVNAAGEQNPVRSKHDEIKSVDRFSHNSYTSPNSMGGSYTTWGQEDVTSDSELHQTGVGPNAEFTYHQVDVGDYSNAWIENGGLVDWAWENGTVTLDRARAAGVNSGTRRSVGTGDSGPQGRPYDWDLTENNVTDMPSLYSGPSYFQMPHIQSEFEIWTSAIAQTGLEMGAMFANGMTFGKIPFLNNYAESLRGEYGDMESVLYYSGAAYTVAVVVAVTVATDGATLPILVGAGVGLGLEAGRQTMEMLDGTREPGDYRARALISEAGLGAAFGALYNCGGVPARVLQAAQYGFLGMGVVSGVQNLRDGHYATGVFDLVTSIVPFAFSRACFVAGTPIRTDAGSRAIEAVEVGDLVLARDEFDPSGPVRARRVLQTFTRVSPVLNLHVGGRVIGTTAEHPFYAADKGWVTAGELRLGDRVLLESGNWMSVDGVADSGQVETVYNMEVEGDHTYFVGEAAWGFAVWAHNVVRYSGPAGEAFEGGGYHRMRLPKSPQHHTFPQSRSLRAWFEERGIDVHDYAVNLERAPHEAIHTGSSWAPKTKQWDKEWNREIMRRLRKAEEDKMADGGSQLTRSEIEAIGRQMLKEYGLDVPFVRYRRGWRPEDPLGGGPRVID